MWQRSPTTGCVQRRQRLNPDIVYTPYKEVKPLHKRKEKRSWVREINIMIMTANMYIYLFRENIQESEGVRINGGGLIVGR